MNIPDEVIEKAVAAHKAPRLHVNDTVHDRIIDMRAAASVVAQWARKEALREAEAAVRSGGIEELNHRLNASPMEFRKGYAESTITAGVSIRALSEGDN